jgi:hypothetical protein
VKWSGKFFPNCLFDLRKVRDETVGNRDRPFANRLQICSPAIPTAAHSQTIVLVIAPAPNPERFLGYIGDELIVTSRQLFLDGARALLARV